MRLKTSSTLAALLAALLCVTTTRAASGGGQPTPFRLDERPQNIAPDPGLKELQVLEDKALHDVTSVVLGPEGTHAYAAAFNPGVVSILDRNPATGKLTFRKSLTDEDHNGAVAFRLSNDGRYGAVSCFRAESLILYGRDAATGDLTKLDVVGGPNDRADCLDFCVDNVFSPDGKHLYSIGSKAIGVYSIENNQLINIDIACDRAQEVDENGNVVVPQIPEMSGGRGIAISPDGLTLLAAWNGSGTLTVHKRDLKTGKLTHSQTIREDDKKPIGMDGIMRVTISRDGRYAYTSSGRMGGLDAVCCFQIKDGTLLLVQSLQAGKLPPKFGGGNEIMISPDQLELAVACTNVDTVARFRRDPDNGALTVIGTENCGPNADPGPAGLCWSPDGKFLHVADEKSSCLVTYKLRAR